jgi:CRP/FNR family transcriptional regulator, dissimilatory nitrate respiration regulator
MEFMAFEVGEISFQDKMEAFSRSPFFSRMSKEVLLALASIAVTVRFKKGDFIFRELDRCAFFYVVKEGRVKDFKQSAGGRQMVVHVCGPGDSLNAVVLFSGNPHFVSAQAMDNSVTLRMRR